MGRCAGVKEAQTRGGCTLSRPTRSLGGGPCASTRPVPPRAPARLLTCHHLRIAFPSALHPPLTTRPPPPSAGYLGDLHSFDPATMTWALLSAADDARRPSARTRHGFTSAGGLLYVHGGSPGDLAIWLI